MHRTCDKSLYNEEQTSQHWCLGHSLCCKDRAIGLSLVIPSEEQPLMKASTAMEEGASETHWNQPTLVSV